MRRELTPESYTSMVKQAVDHFGADAHIVQSLWEQSFSDTTCGFGGIGGQAITTALVLVFVCRSEALVFINGRLAYGVRWHTPEERLEMAHAIITGNILPASDYRGQYGQRLVENPFPHHADLLKP